MSHTFFVIDLAGSWGHIKLALVCAESTQVYFSQVLGLFVALLSGQPWGLPYARAQLPTAMDYNGYSFIVSRQTGMVLDVSEANSAASTPLIAYPRRRRTGELVSQLNGYRVDVSGGSAYNRAAIINYPANNGTNQKWYFKPDGTIQSGLGCQWVLDVEGANTDPGTRVILYERKEGGPSINQQWDVVPYVPTTGFYIRSALNDCYLQIVDGSAQKCAPLCIGNKPGKACGNLKFLRWKYNKETRTICSELNDYAIDVQGAAAANCTKIISYPCHSGANQQWTFGKSGSIVSALGCDWVLDVKASGGAGTPVILYNWHGGKNQQWYISDE
ncbi:hypothetical protein Bbelb_286710 [Branchiostoma belcheri]|nr:hypothetical protein Bbelb_286710 [Branchiostoma belcheri]